MYLRDGCEFAPGCSWRDLNLHFHSIDFISFIMNIQNQDESPFYMMHTCTSFIGGFNCPGKTLSTIFLYVHGCFNIWLQLTWTEYVSTMKQSIQPDETSRRTSPQICVCPPPKWPPRCPGFPACSCRWHWLSLWWPCYHQLSSVYNGRKWARSPTSIKMARLDYNWKNLPNMHLRCCLIVKLILSYIFQGWLWSGISCALGVGKPTPLTLRWRSTLCIWSQHILKRKTTYCTYILAYSGKKNCHVNSFQELTNSPTSSLCVLRP